MDVTSQDNISVFEKILKELTDVIQSSEEFKDIDVYYDEAELNPNISFPCISFKVGQKEVLSSSALCSEYSRRLEIRLITKTIDKRELQSQLYKYEEDLIRVLNNAKGRCELGKEFDYEINETGASSIGALMFNARKEANQFNMIFFSNVIRVRFVVRYSI